MEAPENTIPSFRRAMELGADGVELDVQLSRDGALVVFHDELLSRTTNGEGKLSAMTFAELRRLDAGSRFVAVQHPPSSPSPSRGEGRTRTPPSPQFPSPSAPSPNGSSIRRPRSAAEGATGEGAGGGERLQRFHASFEGERIPMLEEVLAILPDDAVVDVEMKSETDDPPRLVEATLRSVRPHVLRLRLYLSCFSPKFLVLARAKGWDGEVGVLTGDDRWNWAFDKARSLKANIVLPYHENFEKVPAPDTGFFLMPYTVDDPARARALLHAGCNGIITNQPGLLRSALRP